MSCLIQQAIITHISGYYLGEYGYQEGKKHLNLVQRPKLSKNIQFSAVADIYGQNVKLNSDSF